MNKGITWRPGDPTNQLRGAFPAPARVPDLLCPICGKEEIRKEGNQVCRTCYGHYRNDGVTALLNGTPLDGGLYGWLRIKVPLILAEVEGQFNSARTELQNLKVEVRKLAQTELLAKAGSYRIEGIVWNNAFETREKELWQSRGGNGKYAVTRRLEKRVSQLRELLKKANEPPPTVEAEPPAVPTAATSTYEVEAPEASTPEVKTPPPAGIPITEELFELPAEKKDSGLRFAEEILNLNRGGSGKDGGRKPKPQKKNRPKGTQEDDEN